MEEDLRLRDKELAEGSMGEVEVEPLLPRVPVFLVEIDQQPGTFDENRGQGFAQRKIFAS